MNVFESLMSKLVLWNQPLYIYIFNTLNVYIFFGFFYLYIINASILLYLNQRDNESKLKKILHKAIQINHSLLKVIAFLFLLSYSITYYIKAFGPKEGLYTIGALLCLMLTFYIMSLIVLIFAEDYKKKFLFILRSFFIFLSQYWPYFCLLDMQIEFFDEQRFISFFNLGLHFFFFMLVDLYLIIDTFTQKSKKNNFLLFNSIIFSSLCEYLGYIGLTLFSIGNILFVIFILLDFSKEWSFAKDFLAFDNCLYYTVCLNKLNLVELTLFLIITSRKATSLLFYQFCIILNLIKLLWLGLIIFYYFYALSTGVSLIYLKIRTLIFIGIIIFTLFLIFLNWVYLKKKKQ